MTNHLARSSQDPSGRRLRRLSFRPIPETTIEKTEENAQITVKVPSSTLHYVARRRQFLLGSNRLEWQREPQGGPQKLLPSSQVRQEQHNITLPPEMIETGEVAK